MSVIKMKIVLSLLVVFGATFGVSTAAHAAPSAAGPASSSSQADYWCSGDECTCVGDADCNDMFDKFDCGVEWVDDWFGIPIGHCKYPQPRQKADDTVRRPITEAPEATKAATTAVAEDSPSDDGIITPNNVVKPTLSLYRAW